MGRAFPGGGTAYIKVLSGKQTGSSEILQHKGREGGGREKIGKPYIGEGSLASPSHVTDYSLILKGSTVNHKKELFYLRIF